MRRRFAFFSFFLSHIAATSPSGHASMVINCKSSTSPSHDVMVVMAAGCHSDDIETNSS